MKPWTIQYAPGSIGGVKGQKKGMKEIEDYIVNYKKQKKKAALIFGPAGCGKTSSIHAIAKELNYEVLEVNASDVRNKDAITSTIGAAIGTQSFFFKGKIILLDEVEGLSGHKDRGGAPTIIKLMEKSSFPIVMTAMDPYDKKLKNLRKKAKLVEFDSLEYNNVFDILQFICVQENIEFDESALKTLARRCGGDARAAINDLQMLTVVDKKLDKADLKVLGDRERTESMMNALVKVLKARDVNIALGAFDNVNEDFDKRFLWLEENIPREYKKAGDLSRAMDCLSKADVYRGRIRRWQHWRFLVYINALMTAGVAVSKDERYKEFTSYQQSERILKIWMSNMKLAKKKAIAEKIAEKTHSSLKAAIKQQFPYVQHMIKNGNDGVAEYFELDDAEVAWLRK